MSLIRNFGSFAINLTKVINMSKGETLIRRTPYIQFTTNLTNKYSFLIYFGIDEHNKVLYDSVEDRDDEYKEIINILEDYYNHK